MAKKLKKHRRGRTPRSGVKRYPGGSIVHSDRGETPEQAMAVVLSQPHRRWAEKPDDKRLGDALGSLRVAGLITRRQFEAGERFITLSVQYARVIGSPPINPRSPSFEMVSNGLPAARDLADESDEVEIERQANIRRAYTRAVEAVLQHDPRMWVAWNALMRVCAMGRPVTEYYSLVCLRYALDQIAGEI